MHADLGDIKVVVDDDLLTYRKPIGHEIGSPVRVRLEDGTTHLGILAANAPVDIDVGYDEGAHEFRVGPAITNPLIVVPELHRLVWGYESWWAEVSGPEDLRDITDEEIAAAWWKWQAYGRGAASDAARDEAQDG